MQIRFLLNRQPGDFSALFVQRIKASATLSPYWASASKRWGRAAVTTSCGLTPGGRAVILDGLARRRSCSPATASYGADVRDTWPLQNGLRPRIQVTPLSHAVLTWCPQKSNRSTSPCWAVGAGVMEKLGLSRWEITGKSAAGPSREKIMLFSVQSGTDFYLSVKRKAKFSNHNSC